MIAKIAFLFMTISSINHEQHWLNFLQDNEDRYSIYIHSKEEAWGERKKIVYNTTPIGRERYQWFVKINAEIE